MKIIPLTCLLMLHGIFGGRNEASCSESGSPIRTSSAADFAELVKSKHYVDKSNLLEVLLDDEFENSVLIITTPKRIGKSLNMRMIKTFCEIQDPYRHFVHAQNIGVITDTPNYRLFTDTHFFGTLKINQNQHFMREHLGRYPVISINFGTSMRPISSVRDFLAVLYDAISNAFKEHHEYLLQSPVVVDAYRFLLNRWSLRFYHSGEARVFQTESESASYVSILASLLEKHFKRKVILLIDDYDMPIRDVLKSDYMNDEDVERIIKLYATFLSECFEDRSYYKVVLLTGVTHIASAGLTERVPKLKSFLFARNDVFYQYYGFTKSEMERLFEIEGSRFNRSMKEQAYHYYDGYIANNQLIYATEPIIEFLEEGKLVAYWNRLGILSEYIGALRITAIRQQLLRIVESKSIEMENLQKITIEDAVMLRKCVTADYARPGSEEEVAIYLNLILDAGYLKITSRNDTHLRAKVPDSDVRLDIERFLKHAHWYTMSSDMKEYSLEEGFLTGLNSISDVEFKNNVEMMADNLNVLTYRRMKSLNMSHFKESDLDELLRSMFLVNDIQYYTEVPVYEIGLPVDQRQLIGFIDILIPKLSNVYVIIEFEYGVQDSEKLAEKALNQMKNYVGVMNASEYRMTQEAYLLLGIAVLENTSITIAANFVHIQKRIEETVVIAGKL